MLEVNRIYISKLDAAKRQLEIAIRLFLCNLDIVAIHTLTAAAHSLLRDLGKKQNKESLIKDGTIRQFKPEYQKMFSRKLNEAENFFKHADRDNNKLLDFPLLPTELLLWDACSMYFNLTQEDTPLIKIYKWWFFTKYPDFLADKNTKKTVTKLINKLGLNHNNRGQFLNLLSEATKMNST